MTAKRSEKRKTQLAGGLMMAFASLFFGCAAGSMDPIAGDPADSNPQQQTSGIRGTVLRGPVTPGPLVGDEPSELPFAATFHVLDPLDNEVARFESNDDGEFEVRLAPGDYTIVPDESAPVLMPGNQRQPVTVVDGPMVEVTLRFDTGMR